MSALNSTVLSDPSTPLVFLDPTTAYQTTVANYATIGALSVLIWDILENSAADYHLIFKTRFSFSLVAYFLSRIGGLGYMLGDAIYSTAPTGHCKVFDRVVTAFCPISLTCSSILFFLRLRAIYDRNRVVVATFLFLLVGMFVATLFVPLGIVGGPILSTQYCQDILVSPNANAAQIGLLIYDTLIFFAISWRLRSVASFNMGVGESFEVMLFGKHLPSFTKALLLDGQLYYLITLVAGVATSALTYAPGVPGPLTTVASDPYLVVVNIMACRVYRRTKLGLIRESEISTTGMAQAKVTQPIAFAGIHSGETTSCTESTV